MAPPVSHCTAVESSNHHHHIMLSYGGHTHHVITWSSFRLGFTCTDRQKSKWTMGAPFQQEHLRMNIAPDQKDIFGL